MIFKIRGLERTRDYTLSVRMDGDVPSVRTRKKGSEFLVFDPAYDLSYIDGPQADLKD